MSLIGNAIAQIPVESAANEHRGRTLDRFTVSVFGALIRAGVGPLLFAGIVAPLIFGPIFGQNWAYT